MALAPTTPASYCGNGNGTFQAKQDFGTGSSPDSVVIADLNGDGKLDLATANKIRNNISVLLNTYGAVTSFPFAAEARLWRR
jgi:hypothetical protein